MRVILISVLISLCALVSLCAVIYPFKPFKSRGVAGLSLLLCLVLNVVVAMSGTTKGTAHESAPDGFVEPIANAGTPTTPTAPESNWEYRVSTDAMTNADRHIACTTSTNELDFAFPYNGGSKGELCFRRKGKALDAWIQVTKGQFVCGVEECSLRFRFDEGGIQSFQGVESTTDETGLLFLNPSNKLLSQVLKSKQLKLQADYYQEGQQILLFSLSGLDVKQL